MIWPGQRADVGAAVAADLRFVAHAAERHAHELAAERLARSTRASDVLPTPGGPTKQRIGPLIVGVQLAHGQVLEDAVLAPSRGPSDRRRARPWCVARSMTSSVRFVHGSAIEPVEIGARHGVLGRRRPASSTGDRARACASFFTASGMPAASIFSRSSSISFVWSSPSPSSFWIAFICSRRKYSRWFLPTSDCTCDWIFDPSSSTSSSLMQDPVQAVHPRAHVERLEHFLLDGRARSCVRLDAMKSASRPGSVDVHASVCRSSDSSGDSDTTLLEVAS